MSMPSKLNDMYENYTELLIEGLTRGKELQEAYILVLRDRNGENFMPILLSAHEYEIIASALNQQDFSCSKLMNQLARRVGMRLLGVRLLQPRNGQTQALIDFEWINEVVSIAVPMAEAAVAALEEGTSFWVQKDVLAHQVNFTNTSDRMTLPISAMNDKLLHDALQAAVDEDNFELASILRDELKKRNPDTPNDIN